MTFQNTYEFFSESRPVFENCDFRISLQLEKPPEKPIFKHQSPGKIHTHTEELTAHSYTQKKMYEWFVGRFFFIDLWITWDDWYGKSIFSTSSMCLIFFSIFYSPQEVFAILSEPHVVSACPIMQPQRTFRRIKIRSKSRTTCGPSGVRTRRVGDAEDHVRRKIHEHMLLDWK